MKIQTNHQSTAFGQRAIITGKATADLKHIFHPDQVGLIADTIRYAVRENKESGYVVIDSGKKNGNILTLEGLHKITRHDSVQIKIKLNLKKIKSSIEHIRKAFANAENKTKK